MKIDFCLIDVLFLIFAIANSISNWRQFFPGFTALCEKYADMVTKDSSCGTDKLTATLNNYIGKIVDCTFASLPIAASAKSCCLCNPPELMTIRFFYSNLYS